VREREPAEATVEVEPPAARVEGPAPHAVLALQRTIGNRAVARALSIQRTPTQVTHANREERSGGLGPIGWTSAYEVEFTGSECRLNINVCLARDADVTEAQWNTVKGEAESEFRRVWDNKIRLTESGTGTTYDIRVRLTWVTSGEHVRIALHSGTGHANRRNWYVTPPHVVSRAHELGHQLGLYDEYVDPEVINRATATSPGVYTDNSIMGHTYSEGPTRATVKLRHAQRMANHISAATGRTFTGSLVP
jgi:hypothetical protein